MLSFLYNNLHEFLLWRMLYTMFSELYDKLFSSIKITDIK